MKAVSSEAFAHGNEIKKPSLLTFSHLRWSFVFQRPQHVMSRLQKIYNVFFWEEPIYVQDQQSPDLQEVICEKTGVTILTPVLPQRYEEESSEQALRLLLDKWCQSHIQSLTLWYYTPMMRSFSNHNDAEAIIYDCMDELANFKNAPSHLLEMETALLAVADLVFTGGRSLYEAKRPRHPHVYNFPSSVDKNHFAKARELPDAQEDQRNISHPRLGYCGVIDERLDLALLDTIAVSNPTWSIVMIGPVVKIDPASLPQRPNIYYLGSKDYTDLPAYMCGWDVALMPFALNDSTKYISPTKTPEYLAAGLPVVSTAVQDVVRSYGGKTGVYIAHDQSGFSPLCRQALEEERDPRWYASIDAMLSHMSWDHTAVEMLRLMGKDVKLPIPASTPPKSAIQSRKNHYDVLVVGAGFAGSVMAERLARDGGYKVLLVDRREHIGGNAYDYRNAHGILVHKYGPHIFHTNSSDVFDYLSRFTKWRPYVHKVLSSVDNRLVPFPINRNSVNMLYDLHLQNDEEVAQFFADRCELIHPIKTSEDVVLSAVGRDIYEKFFKGYTKKQWGLWPSELDKSVTARVPTRVNDDDRYFTDTYQAMPLHGYTQMFSAMLDHPNIDVMLGVYFRDIRENYHFRHLVYTGPIDEYYDYIYGKLPYRSLDFVLKSFDREYFQQAAVINYPDQDIAFTRITEFKYLTGDDQPATTICYEYPKADGDPYYPIPRAENQEIYKKYERLSMQEDHVSFVGRLATYRYYNMDQVVGQALATYRKMKIRHDDQIIQSASVQSVS